MAEMILGIAGLAGTVDLCTKQVFWHHGNHSRNTNRGFSGGKCLVKAARDYAQADTKMAEVSIRIEACWARITLQLDIIKQLESTMDKEQRDLNFRILGVLESKLEAAILALSKLDKHKYSGAARKLQFIGMKENLESAVAELESWQKLFKPAWFQLIKAAPSAIELTLEKQVVNNPGSFAEPVHEALGFRRAFETRGPIFIAEKALQGYEIVDIAHCKAQVATDNRNIKCHIIDIVSLSAVKLKDARNLAYRLRYSNAKTFGMMKCKGIVRLSQSAELGFVFRVPDGFDEVRSLRDLLLAKAIPKSLSIRLEMARQLVTAVYYVHLYEFVHKRIRPDTILSLAETQANDGFPVLCLVGFQSMRHSEGKTNSSKLDDQDVIYQHPVRQEEERPDYVMQHDIYSLGVCLLEIGLWESLVKVDPKTNSLAADPLVLGQGATSFPGVYGIKERLVALSKGRLRVTMGDRYSRAVETCLTCLDPDNMDFGNAHEFQDDDGVEVGARYVEKVMSVINSISI